MKPGSKKKMITAIFALVIGSVGIWMGFKLVKTYFEVRSWTLTDATVLSKKVDYKSIPSGYNYSVKVEYKYLFNSQEYTNGTVFIQELMGGLVTYRLKWQPDKVVADLKDKIKVYVNPESPAQSVIFCDGILLWGFVFVVGCIATVSGLVMLIKML